MRFPQGAPRGQRFFLYLLLLEAAGATSFDDLRTVAAMVCGSFREADVARGSAGDDREHHVALEDAASRRSAAALRALFALLSMQTEVADPPGLSGAASARRSARTSYARSARWRPRRTPCSPSSRTCFRLSRTQAQTSAFPLPRFATEPAYAQRVLWKALCFDAREQTARADSVRAATPAGRALALQTAARSAARALFASPARRSLSFAARRRRAAVVARCPPLPLRNLFDSRRCLSATFPIPEDASPQSFRIRNGSPGRERPGLGAS